MSSDKRGLNMDYLPSMRARLSQPLVEHGSEGVGAVLGLLGDYDMTRDDMECVMDITRWPNSSDPLASLESKVRE